MNMLDQLPTEISTNILHRLPVKTLIRCTALSKPFLSLITSRDFIYAHLAQNTASYLLLRYATRGFDASGGCSYNKCKKIELYHFEPDDETFSGFRNQGLTPLPIPVLNNRSTFFSVVGCVNGVVCLVNDDACYEGTLILLWNPSIRKYVRVPKPQYVYESAYGFGYDSVSDDYKVVRVVDLGPEYEKTQVEVYSLRSGCWRFVGVGPSYSIERGQIYKYTPCFLRGSVHWVGVRSMIDENYENVILKFNMSEESFENIEVPSMLKESRSKHNPMIDFYVQECKGMLALFNQKYDRMDRSCSVWLMKEYGVVTSWTKIFDFQNISLSSCGVPRALGFRNNGEVIMVKGKGDGNYDRRLRRDMNVVVSIDPVTQGETIISEILANGRSFFMSYYVESMVLFKEGKRIEDLAQEDG